ncbi:ankyrin repeat domain-containing protein [Pseudothauera rhizosphaerae]|uniref:Ankyrin repeat domain-containing protein n=1 Tax=Pseudothauera rhizosphaerae TaxID=2565932 RepID=A0A4S4AC23_9RHOO|nr:ankyrin repeat domain-containing protein [Pseudothauera rhizosphaerae]THF56512.1 ankyrin repeat domain-containing protein [Pseudothauera rhizosphaerae]
MRPATDTSILRPYGFPRLLVAVLACLFVAAAAAQGSSYEDSLSSARLGDTRQLAALLARGIDPNTVDAQGNSLLMLAAREGHKATVETLLRYRPSLGLRNLAGDSALMLAVLKGHEDVADLLLAAGAPVDQDGWTPLHYAAFEGRTALVDKLLASGARIDAPAPNQATPLMIAARNGHIDVVRRLLAAGADVDLKNDRGLTADAWARAQGNTDIAALIEAARTRRR